MKPLHPIDKQEGSNHKAQQIYRDILGERRAQNEYNKREGNARQSGPDERAAPAAGNTCGKNNSKGFDHFYEVRQKARRKQEQTTHNASPAADYSMRQRAKLTSHRL